MRLHIRNIYIQFEHILSLKLKKQSRRFPYIPDIFLQNIFQVSDIVLQDPQESCMKRLTLYEMSDLPESDRFV